MDTLQTYTVDLRSDTVTRPTNSMRQAMANATVGDDVYGEDPTVNALERKVALLLGKQSALFVPTATMANLLAVMVHCDKRGAECIVGNKAHIFKYEQGGASQLGGVMITTLKNNPDGTFDLDELRTLVRGEDIHEPKTMMVAIENTHNVCGGRVVPMAWIEQLAVVAKELSLSLHMDGSRLFNASQYLGMEPADVVKAMDSISICFSKGLGAPAGAALVGSFSFIRQARRLRKVLGGGMRQVGVLAAPAIVALDELVPALIGDHRRAKFLGEAIASKRSPSFTVDLTTIQTNILMVNISPNCKATSDQVVARLATVTDKEIKDGCVTESGEAIVVKIISMGSRVMRITTYFEISDIDVNYAIQKLNYVFKEMQ